MLLKTRFYLPPLRQKSVYRGALMTRLNGTNGGDLVLISAPAGYGKSTLVSQWLHHFPHTFSWLSLDLSHNSPLQFWRYIINAIRNIQPDIGNDAIKMIAQGQDDDMTDIVISLLNDLDQLSSHHDQNNAISLVLDDFHLLTNETLLSLINLFIDHLPTGLRVVLTSRIEPALSLARRRVNNQLIEFNLKDMAFSPEESKQFFSESMAIAIEEQVHERIFKGTEGWIAGLQLAAISLKSGDTNTQQLGKNSNLERRSGLNRHIEDYLFEEVFSLQTIDTQIFLIQSSFVQRFCAGLGNAISESTHSQSILLTLEQSNLFLIPIDNHRTWFRYHDLFRQFLNQHFQNLPAAEQAKHHTNAAQWYEQSGYPEDAIEHYILAQQHPEAVVLINGLLSEYNTSQQATLDPALLLSWYEKLPKAYSSNIITLEPDSREKTKTHSQLKLIPGAAALTQRENEVLSLLIQGLTNKDIAEQLHISINTLKVHIRNLYGKIGVENRTQALVKLNQHKPSPSI